MISNAFKGAYTNAVAQQNQGIGNISQGVKDAATAVLGSLGFVPGAYGTSEGGQLMSMASKHALAGRVGGIGGNLMLATLEEKKADAELNQILANASESSLGEAFDKVVKGAKTAQEFEAATTVYEKITKMRQKELENKMLKDVGKNIKEKEVKDNDNDR